jgi:hypothetical protein
MASTAEFRTDSLPFACFLHSTGKLRFLRCEEARGNGRLEFVFNDPQSQGDGLNIEFESGAEAPAAAYFDSIRHLRRVMDRTREQRSNKQNVRSFIK